jgi:hypothetical protein
MKSKWPGRFDKPPIPVGRQVFAAARARRDFLARSTASALILETIFSGQAVRLGTPCYDVLGCDGPTHCGLFIVPAGSAARELHHGHEHV